ncbi:MAG: alanine--glyoxylate aminotransferase family protein [Bdellovibrionales bacterium]|nr:alanine--glyoxylate aminotransferase family protein [Bdellovibrionales bacterium]
MTKYRLFTPGPVEIPERVLAAMAKTDVHHRTKEFMQIFSSTAEKFRQLVDSEHSPLFLACTGTGALEAALINSAQEGELCLYVSAGKFGERWGKIARRAGIEGVPIEANWGDSPALSKVRETCAAHPEAKVFCIQHCETSTGVLHPIEEIIPMVREECPSALIIVDSISSITTSSLSQRKLGIDILICAAQKALQLPPGLTILGLSNRAAERIQEGSPHSLYFDLKHELKNQAEGSSSWTPAIAHILGLGEVCQMIEEEGLDHMIERHNRLSKLCRFGLTQLGCTPVAEEYPANSLTPATPPEGIDAEVLRKKLQNTFHVLIAGGQDHWSGKYFRVGHMGSFSEADMRMFLGVLYDALSEMEAKLPEKAEFETSLCSFV